VNHERPSAVLTWKYLFALAVFGSVVPIVLQGLEFAIANNVYHIPIALRLFDQAQFPT